MTQSDEKDVLPRTGAIAVHAWLAWCLFVGIGIAVVLLIPVYEHPLLSPWSLVNYWLLKKEWDFLGCGLADGKWGLFFFTFFVAMYRIRKGEIQHDGRGLLVFFTGLLLFGFAQRLPEYPRVACLGLPMIMYGGSRYIFGPVGKCMFIPFFILFLCIPLRQIVWLESGFIKNVESLVLLSGGKRISWMGIYHAFDLLYVSVLCDALLGLLLLFFLTRMNRFKMIVIILLVLISSYVAAAGIIAFSLSDATSFGHKLPVHSLSRGAGWLLPLAILVFELCRLNRQKTPRNPHALT